jgi:polyisoprenoid-binding protein YceI
MFTSTTRPTRSRIPRQQSAAASLPPAGHWLIDTDRSSVSFSGRASRLAPTVRAEFNAIQGGLHLAPDLNESEVGVCVDVRTITTGNPLWDGILRAADPFRSAEHPLAHFQSRSVLWTGSRFHVDGELELAGVATPLALEATFDLQEDGTAALSAGGSIEPGAAQIRLDVPAARLLMPRALNLSIAVIAKRTRNPAASRRFALAS